MITAYLTRSGSAVGGTVRRALAWWLGELAAMVPAALIGRLGRHDGEALRLRLTPNADMVLLARAADGVTAAQDMPIGLADAAQARARVNGLLSARHLGRMATVYLDPASVLRTSLDLPLAAEKSLSDVLAFQLDRLSPLPASEICLAHRVIGRTPATGRMTVHIVIASQASVAFAREQARRCGLLPGKVVVAQGDGGAEAPVDIVWQAPADAGQTGVRRWLCHGMEIAAAVLLLSALLLHLHQLDRVAADMRAEAAQAKSLSAKASEERQLLDQTEQVFQLLRKRRGETAPLAVVNELTNLIPATAWVQRLTMRDRTVEISGFAPRATELLARFEGAAMFANARFVAPITLAPGGQGEHFTLVVDLRAEAGR